MRTEEQDGKDLEDKLNPRTVDCRTGVCKHKQRIVSIWSKCKKFFYKNKGRVQVRVQVESLEGSLEVCI